MTLQLVCVHRGRFDDERLYWTVYDGTNWTEDVLLPNGAKSTSAPALAVLDNKLYCAHRGRRNDTNLWWCCYDPSAKTWSDDHELPIGSDEGPALAVDSFDTLYMVHKDANEGWLWYSVFDKGAQTWSQDYPFSQNNKTASGPALINFNNWLWCVHRGNSDQNLDWSIYNNIRDSWSADTEFSQGNLSATKPALFVKDNVLYCVHRGYNYNVPPVGDPPPPGDQQLYCCSFNGSNWTVDEPIHTESSLDGPAVAVIDDQAVCVFNGVNGDQYLHFMIMSNGTWGTSTKFSRGNCSNDGVGLAVLDI